ncbi:CpaF family protein [Ruminococcus sp. HUN007]|uniref:CpaF family protein n=1 Tax=Ruminococcus sp. HUN007 TaxID=1514668 RepID=UPI0005D28940|nr:CpaF family protein [Ruminococcus sp. HUN007]
MTAVSKSTDLQELEKELKAYVREHFVLTDLSDEELFEKVKELVMKRTADIALTVSGMVSLTESVYSSIRGFGILDMIMKDDTVTEVMINGCDSIWIEKKGRLQKLPRSFESEAVLEDTIQRIVSRAGREVNQANPIVDTRLPDGSRVNVVLPPVSVDGPVVTIRKFSVNHMTMETLIGLGSLTAEVADVLRQFVRAGYNIFISGGTGSGKTTFLNALSDYIPAGERVITIEDSAELQITGVENLVRLETRNANTSGSGEIQIRDLIKSSLRMRPERIIVGEVRGAEALDMLTAMNTGHDGSLSTGHANSAADMLTRLETMVLSGTELPLPAIRNQIASAIDIVVHLSRMRDHTRKVTEISELTGVKDGMITVNPLYVFEEDEKSTLNEVHGSLKRTENAFESYEKLRRSGINMEV